MKNFTKILALVLAFTFVLAIAVVGISAGASQSAWYAKAVEYLDSLGISDIGSDGEAELARDEFVTWVAKIESHQTIESAWAKHEYVATTTFDDVEDSEHKGAIGYATNAGFIEGYGDRTFKPHQQIVLGEAALILVRLMRYKAFLFTEGDDWGYNAMQTAQYYFNAFDETFLRETATYDPAYTLTKGEGAYLLYCIMNGEAWEDGDVEDDDLRLAIDVLGLPTVDLGAPFARNGKATVKQQFVVTNVPLVYTSFVMNMNRTDTYLAGATYASTYENVLYNSNGDLDTTGYVFLRNLSTGAYMTLSAQDFSTIVKEAAGHVGTEEKPDLTSPLLYAEQGSVLTISVAKENKALLTDNQDEVDIDLFTNVTINNALIADSYIGGKALAKIDVTKGNRVTGWKFASTDGSLNAGGTTGTYTRLSSESIYWTDLTYKYDGSLKSAKLVVNGQAYDVVKSYTGKAAELKVFAPAGILEETSKVVASTVGYVGDTVYAGGVFSDSQKAILLLHGDYAAHFDGNTVKEDFTLTSEIPSFVSYELEVEGGAFVTNTTFMLTSNFVKDGRLDDNYIDTEAPLSAVEARELILSPAQGECNVVFSDLDGDGLYDVAVVTESTRALYYGEVNGGEDGLNGKDGDLQPGSYGRYGEEDTFTKEIYDSFGNFIFSAPGLKGNSIGGLVIDKTVTAGGTSGSGTDNWATAAPATNKVQLVVIGSNERLPAGIGLQISYGASAMHAYKTVDVATLTTAYIEKVSATTVTFDDAEYYVATVKELEDKETITKILFIPVAVESQITLPVTLDGVTSDVTFNSGKSLMSFVTNHTEDTEIGQVQDGAWMAGHTVKYVANSDTGIVWCMVEAAEVAAVKGFVAGVEKTDDGDNTYKVTVVKTGASGLAETTTNVAEPTFEYLRDHIHVSAATPNAALAFGMDAWFYNDIPVEFYKVTPAAEALMNAGKIEWKQYAAGTNENRRSSFGILNLGDRVFTGLYYTATPMAADVELDNSGETAYYILTATGYTNVAATEAAATAPTNFTWKTPEGLATFAATEDEEVDVEKTYFTYSDVDDKYTPVEIEEFEVTVTYYERTAVDANSDFSATTNYYAKNITSGDYEKVAALGANFAWAQKSGVTYYASLEDAGEPDGTKLPIFKMTWNANRTNAINGANPNRFLAGTIIAVADYERNVRDEYKGLVEVTAVVTADNFESLGQLYAANGNELNAYDADAKYYAYLFEYVPVGTYTSGDLFGGFNEETDLSSKTWVKTATSSEIGTATGKYNVTGSATAVWDYDAATWEVVNNLLANGKLFNVDNADEDGKVSAQDLVYVTLTKATDYAGTHYTIDGLDAAAYGTTLKGKAFNGDQSMVSNGTTGLRGQLIDAASAYNSHWSANQRYGWYYDAYVTGAGDDSMWTVGGEADKFNGTTFNNYYILDYVKTSAEPTPIYLRDSETGEPTEISNGMYETYNMIVGKNPYYQRTVSGGKITYTLMFETVEALSGVKGYKYYQLDLSKTDVYMVRKGDSTSEQRVSTDPSDIYHTDNSKYYVDSEGKVWGIVNNITYNTSKFISNDPTYDTTGSEVASTQENISFADTKTTFALTKAIFTKDLVTISVAPDATVPAFYQVSIKTGLKDTKAFGMTKNASIVVVTPVSNTATGNNSKDNSNFKITVLSPADLGSKAIFATSYQFMGGTSTCTQLTVFGEIVDPSETTTPTTPTTPTDPTTPTWKSTTVKGAVKVVYLNSTVDVIADAVLYDNSWVIRSTAPAIDVTTGEELDNIKYVFGTYLTRSDLENAKANLAAGGYFVVNANNEVIAQIDETKADLYGTDKLSVTVETGKITAATPDGKTTAEMFGKSQDVSDKTFVFLYHDLDGANFGIGGSSKSVEIKTEAEIIASYSTDTAIVEEGVGGKNDYDQAQVDEAAANIAAARAAAVGAYFNGTFWNVSTSPAYRYLAIQQISGQKADVSFSFNFIVIDDVVYVFVNSFAK